MNQFVREEPTLVYVPYKTYAPIREGMYLTTKDGERYEFKTDETWFVTELSILESGVRVLLVQRLRGEDAWANTESVDIVEWARFITEFDR